jgi:hypothetical protein
VSLGNANVIIDESILIMGESYFDGNLWVNNQTLVIPGLINAADDSTAAGLGVPLWGMYRNGNILQIRIV